MAEKLTGYQSLKIENEALTTEKIQLSAKVAELWQKSENLQNAANSKQRELEALKLKLEDLNDISRQNLLKKNFDADFAQELKNENTDLKKEIGVLNEKISTLNENSILDKQRFDALKEIETGLNLEISGLQKRLNEFNEFKQVQDRAAVEKENSLKSLNLEIAKLKNENADFKNQIVVKNSNMYYFKTVVIFLAVLANYFLLGKKFLNLTGDDDWQTYFISYGSVLVFDLTVILLTLLNKSKEALYFAIGVFVLTFLQIAKPFKGLGLEVDFWGFDLVYFERFVSGGIYSLFFAFLPYFLSKITKE